MIKTIVKIDGMMCGMCENHINECIRNKFKVKKVKSSHSKGECEIISEEALPETELKASIDATGYTFISADSEEYVKKGIFG